MRQKIKVRPKITIVTSNLKFFITVGTERFFFYVDVGVWWGYGVERWCCFMDEYCGSDLYVDDGCSAKEVIVLSER